MITPTELMLTMRVWFICLAAAPPQSLRADAFAELIDHVTSMEGPSLSRVTAVAADSTGITARLTDTSTFTGTHKAKAADPPAQQKQTQILSKKESRARMSLGVNSAHSRVSTTAWKVESID